MITNTKLTPLMQSRFNAAKMQAISQAGQEKLLDMEEVMASMLAPMNVVEYNPATDADSYKVSMPWQYPANTTRIHTYVEARGSVSKPSDMIIDSLKKYLSPEMLKVFIAENTTQPFDKTVMFGLQYILLKYLSTPITRHMVELARANWTDHGMPFNYDGWMRIVTEFNGRLPLRVRAVPEGTVVPLRNALITLENTHDDFAWIVTHFETMILRVWYPITVATLSAKIRSIVKKYLELSSDDLSGLNFKHHDFGARGVSSMESAAIGGAAHLAAGSMGSDTMSAIEMLQKYYMADAMPAYSIPAMEHSTVTSWTRAGETDAYRNMIRQYSKPGKIFAIVIDSYNYRRAIEIFGTDLKDLLLETGGTLVLRPDSGVPKDVVLEVIELAAKYFGFTVNSKGFKVLPVCIRVIQGDGITLESIPGILQNVIDAGWSMDNLALGQGGGLLQMVNRDTLQFACKCSAALIDGTYVDVYKDPIGDSGKRSKRGVQNLYRHKVTGEFATLRVDSVDLSIYEDAMVTVFEDGAVMNLSDLEEVQARSAKF